MSISNKLRAELVDLKSDDGMIHAHAVVAWAKRHRRSALHRQFEWNDGKAAHEYRIWQARRLIQINVITEGGSPLLVSLSVDRPAGGGYREIGDVVRSQELSEIMLRDALQELERVKGRYAMVKELTSVWFEVDKVKTAKQRKKAA